MDTTLITFMIQTSSSTQSVHLIGSWDNFTKHYPMERDVRRARGQWRGCYAFEDIICDGDGGSSPKRTGGLKMGSTYYYYYELDDGTEHYDASIPFTTSCPFLPGQPINLLWVPIEVQPLRYRSASMSSMANEDIKTMNPKDKFMTPRAPPPPPTLSRLKTSTSVLAKKRSARSLSPKSEKNPWSPRMFFGLRSPGIQDTDKRGRSSSPSKASDDGTDSSNLSLFLKPYETHKVQSVPHNRASSPQSFKRLHSRSPSPLKQVTRDTSPYSPGGLFIPDDIAEEGEDDDNFANLVNRTSMNEKGILTPLAPPPSGHRSPLHLPSVKDTSKPLPQLPEEGSRLPPPPHLRSAVSAAELPRSHFSVSTIATAMTSPSDSHFSVNEVQSVDDLNDEDDLIVDIGSGDDEFTYSPVLAESPLGGFGGYSLPEDYGSKLTVKEHDPVSHLTQTASRTTFGAPAFSPVVASEIENMTALGQLLSEMSYLGDVIVGK